MNRSDVAILARRLIAEHLTSKGADNRNMQGWTFQFDRAVNRFGRCYYSKKMITVSERLAAVNDEAHVRHTILHEIAHALAYSKYNETGHGYRWQSECAYLGIPAARLHPTAVVTVRPSPVAASDNLGVHGTQGSSTAVAASTVARVPEVRIKPPWVAWCPNCNKKGSQRHRRSSKKLYCGQCLKANGRRFDSAFLIKWIRNV